MRENIEQQLIEETQNRGYDYLDVGEPEQANYHQTDIVICNRDAPTEHSNEGEYLVCVSYSHEPEEFAVFSGRGQRQGYDVTNEQGYYDSIDAAFDRVDELFAEQE